MNILSLGEKIKKLRKEKNMTLKELAGGKENYCSPNESYRKRW